MGGIKFEVNIVPFHTCKKLVESAPRLLPLKLFISVTLNFLAIKVPNLVHRNHCTIVAEKKV